MMSHAKSTRGVDSFEQRKANTLRSFGESIINQRIWKLALESGEGASSGKIRLDSTALSDYVFGSFKPQEGNDWRGSIKAMVKQLKTATKFGFTQAEFDSEILRLERSLKSNKKKNNGRLSSSYVNSFINHVERGDVWISDKSKYKWFKKYIKGLTTEDIQTAVVNAVANFKPVIWLSGSEVQGVSPRDVLSVYEQMNSAVVEPLDINESKVFSYQNFGPTGKVKSRRIIDDLGVVQIVFENNVRLNFKKTKVKGKKGYMSVRVGEGWSAFPVDDYGLTKLASLMYLGGLKAHKYSEFAQLFPAKKLNTKMLVGKDRLIFNGPVGKKDTFDQLKLWAAQVSAPGYRDEWYQLYAKSFKKSAARVEDSPKRVAQRYLSDIWSSGDKRFVFPGLDEVLTKSIDDVREIVDPMLSKGAIEIGIVGNFKEKKIIAEVAKTFGALASRELDFRSVAGAFDVKFPESDHVTLTHKGESDQGAIYLAWPLFKEYNVERYRQYQIIRQILRMRIYDLIREQEGIAYSPKAKLRFSKITQNPNSIYVSAEINAKHHAHFESLVKEIVIDLRKGTITQDELHRAIKPILEDLEKGQSTNRHWSHLVGLAQSKPHVVELYRTHREILESMSPEILNAEIRQLFSPDLLHIVTIVPQSINRVNSKDTIKQ